MRLGNYGKRRAVGWGMAMMFVMIVFAILLIIGAVWLIQNFSRSRGGRSVAAPDRDDPLRVLERRFAEGEIDVEEYRERHRALETRR